MHSAFTPSLALGSRAFTGQHSLAVQPRPTARRAHSPARRACIARRLAISCENERSANFTAEGRFYRASSVVVRDLGVLCSAVAASRLGRDLRALDACSGSGVRSLRYLGEGGASFVWANDAQTPSTALAENLAAEVAGGRAKVSVNTLEEMFAQFMKAGEEGVGDGHGHGLYDIVDLDVFGACTQEEMQMALQAVSRSGGLLYLSSTDATTAAGHNEMVAQRAWGASLRSLPAANEQFLRVVIGTCARVAAEMGLEIKPVFSFFHNISSTARVMVRVKAIRSDKTGRKSEKPNVGFISHCLSCGENGSVPGMTATEASNLVCAACGTGQGDEFVVSGPVWTGRLHNVEYLREMRALARTHDSEEQPWGEVSKMISKLIEEADQPPLFYMLGDVAKRIGASIPPRQRIFDELARRGYSASPVHCKPKAIKTNAPFAELLDAAKTAAADVKVMLAAAAMADSGSEGNEIL